MGKLKNIVLWVALSLVVLLPNVSTAQCAMCRAVLESEGNTGAAEAVNNGIVFLMAMPYLLVGVVGYVIYKKIRK